jgi:hypothetical protein
MKNRNENTTIIQFSYRSFTFFKRFFKIFIMKVLRIKKALLKRAFFIAFSEVQTMISMTTDLARS